jgi:uncharacterized protein YdgA (DUF945 family)
MTNIVELRTHPKHQKATTSAAERAAVVADIVTLTAGVREVVEKAVELSGPSLEQLERTAQHLVDALHQLEAAAEVLTADGECVPF